MKFFMFHLMPWPFLPDDFEQHHKSAWVTCPNTYYDPQRGTTVYNEYLDQLQQAEALGFDGVCINEHHQNAYGNMPSPNLICRGSVAVHSRRDRTVPREQTRYSCRSRGGARLNPRT